MLKLILVIFSLGAAGPIGAADIACHPTPEIQEILKSVEHAGNPLDTLTADSAPALWLKREVDARKILTTIQVASVKDLAIPARNRQIPLRIYYPLAKAAKLPILLFVHGGGWTLGSVGTYDNIAKALANQIPAIVVSVDYRLAPEHPFPAALDDVFLATAWVAKNAADLGGNPARIGVAGDSSGGNLATVVARRAKHAGIDLAFQALFYPSTDLSRSDYNSSVQLGRGYLLTQKAMEHFRHFYLPQKSDWTNSEASPLLAEKSEIALLPPTLIVVAGCDPLRDEGIAYANKIKGNGGKVLLMVKENMIHGFLSFYNTNAKVSPQVESILTEISNEMRKLFR